MCGAASGAGSTGLRATDLLDNTSIHRLPRCSDMAVRQGGADMELVVGIQYRHSADDLPLLFERFRGAQCGCVSGSGLGLAIVSE